MVERRHRQRARVEDGIREDKDTGLARLQFREFALNEVWLEIVLLAHDLIIWTQTLLLEGELAVAFHRLKARRRPTHQPSRSSPAAGAGRQAQTIAARREPKPRQRQRGDGRNRRPRALLHPSPPQRLPKPDRSHYSATTVGSTGGAWTARHGRLVWLPPAATSNRACGSPAHGSPTFFTAGIRLISLAMPGRGAARRWFR